MAVGIRGVAACLFAIASVLGSAVADDRLDEIRVDYAYYSPPSLVLKRFGWLEESFKADGTAVRWVLSQGSNRALEYLAGGGVDFGSTAGLAALLARANDNPIRTVYVYSRPEWTALAVRRDSPLRSVADLKGRKIAATKGTDPYLFLLRSLRQFNVNRGDVEIVHLQHPDGRVALEQGRVDAWAGLDPHLAASELDAGSRILYRNPAFNTYGVLNTTQAFLDQHPKEVRRMLGAYERARQWISAHPRETARIVAEEAHIPLAVAERLLARTGFPDPAPGGEQRDVLVAAAPLLVEEGLIRKGVDPIRTIDELLEPGPAREAVAAAR